MSARLLHVRYMDDTSGKGDYERQSMSTPARSRVNALSGSTATPLTPGPKRPGDAVLLLGVNRGLWPEPGPLRRRPPGEGGLSNIASSRPWQRNCQRP